jgi:subtilisin family serine protease
MDTGGLESVVDASDRLQGVLWEEEPSTVGHYSGHGTFVAGVVRQYAPRSDVWIMATFSIGGAVFESEFIRQMAMALEWGPDAISVAGGTRTRLNLPLLSMQVLYEERLSRMEGTVVIAPAGNDGSRVPFWPAAFPWVVSVGALEGEGSRDPVRAGFTNYGSWVDVYAKGVNVSSDFITGSYTYKEPPDEGTVEFSGTALWSGTSFAVPQVAGLVAARMTWSGESGSQASASLLDLARTSARPYVGAVLDEIIGARPAGRDLQGPNG